ncbi:hypothetical protein ABE527_17350 [Brucella sp. TWI432]
MGNKSTFEVTEKASGPFVAGVRNPGVGKTLQLTEDQAQYALISGELRRPEIKTTEPALAKTKKD